jgi:hypothetical protein
MRPALAGLQPGAADRTWVLDLPELSIISLDRYPETAPVRKPV